MEMCSNVIKCQDWSMKCIILAIKWNTTLHIPKLEHRFKMDKYYLVFCWSTTDICRLECKHQGKEKSVTPRRRCCHPRRWSPIISKRPPCFDRRVALHCPSYTCRVVIRRSNIPRIASSSWGLCRRFCRGFDTACYRGGGLSPLSRKETKCRSSTR